MKSGRLAIALCLGSFVGLTRASGAVKLRAANSVLHQELTRIATTMHQGAKNRVGKKGATGNITPEGLRQIVATNKNVVRSLRRQEQDLLQKVRQSKDPVDTQYYAVELAKTEASRKLMEKMTTPSAILNSGSGTETFAFEPGIEKAINTVRNYLKRYGVSPSVEEVEEWLLGSEPEASIFDYVGSIRKQLTAEDRAIIQEELPWAIKSFHESLPSYVFKIHETSMPLKVRSTRNKTEGKQPE